MQMSTCEYCGESFENEQQYLRHLKSDHQEELSNLDARRVEGVELETDGSVRAVLVGMVLLALFVLLGTLLVAGPPGFLPYP